MKKETGRDREKAGFFNEKKLKKVGKKVNQNNSKRKFQADDEDED